jgi:hypothetical protein
LTYVPNIGWDAYRTAFRDDIYQLLAWGYSDARPRITAVAEEEEITGFIVEAIEARLDDPRTDERYTHYEISEDKPLPGEFRTGKRRRRADIRVRSTALRPRPRYLFEGKRLRRSGGFGITKYIGPNGLRRFLDATGYSDYSSDVSMIGYVQSDTAHYWAAELAAILGSSEVSELQLQSGFERESAIKSLEHCYLTVHLNHAGERVQIGHILLDCT